jgi:enoyl-CoA hydratase/carnithine racemase
MDEPVRYEVDKRVATITLNRPEKLNAINPGMGEALRRAWKTAADDDDVRCVLLTGEGKAFCVGDDIYEAWSGERFEAIMKQFREEPEKHELAFQLDYPKPVVAAINGYCFGGALEIVLWADVLIASEQASFAANFVQFGLVGGATTFWRMPRLIGASSAALMLLAGERIEAEEAARMGLVSRVVPHGELLPSARRIAETIASHSPLAIRLSRDILRTSIGATAEGQRDVTVAANTALATVFASEDQKEAVQAWIQKREPVFTGR